MYWCLQYVFVYILTILHRGDYFGVVTSYGGWWSDGVVTSYGGWYSDGI